MVKGSSTLRVCYFGTYRASYSRNRIMIEGLRRNGVEVIECHQTLWHGIEDRVDSVTAGWYSPRLWWRILHNYVRLLGKFLRLDTDFDILVLGYPGQSDVFLARLLAWLYRKPLVWDVFMSIYLIATERELDTRSPWGVRLLKWLERMAVRLPDSLIIDTAQYAHWFADTYQIDQRTISLVPTGADDRLFSPGSTKCHNSNSQSAEIGDFANRPITILYYGTFIPNHGVQWIVEAAHLLRHESRLRFVMIGEGPEKAAAQRYCAEHQLTNISFCQWMSQRELCHHIARADLCLGVFGITPQSLMTVQNKIYECLASARPVLSGDSPAIRDVLVHGEHIYLCRRADSKALAESIQTLVHDSDTLNRLAKGGYQRFLESFTVELLGKQYRGHLVAAI